MAQILELFDKHFKETIIKMHHWAIMNATETNTDIEGLSKK